MKGSPTSDVCRPASGNFDRIQLAFLIRQTLLTPAASGRPTHGIFPALRARARGERHLNV